MKEATKLARRIFLVAGIYGLVATLPLYFFENVEFPITAI